MFGCRSQDGNNFGPSLIAAVGDYTGGDLGVWPEDDRSSKLNEMPKSQRFQARCEAQHSGVRWTSARIW